MLDRLIKVLNECNVSDYSISEKTIVSHQAFFIKQKLDQHRISDTKQYDVTIFVDIDGKRGQTTKELFDGQSDEELRKEIENMKFDASLGLNPYFELVKDQKHFEAKEDFNLLDALKNVIKAVSSINDTETELINSYEVFVNQNYVHIVNSQGLDVSYNKIDEMVEIIINSIKDGHEVEVYHMSTCGPDQPAEVIADEIRAVFKKAHDRSNAVNTKQMLNQHVLISGIDLREFFEYFIEKSNTRAIFSRVSQVKVGDVVQSSDDCDKITLEIKEKLPRSSKNIPYASDGLKCKDYVLFDEGKYAAYNGDYRTAYYLGIKDVAPAYNYVVKAGSKSVEEMKKDEYLEIVQFSNFQMDAMTGDFGGEIRLAYYYDGKTVTPVTAGSITCNMNNVLNHIYLSKEQSQFDYCVIPSTIELFDINVSGQ